MTEQELDRRLQALADEQYRDFSSRLIPGGLPMLGVRLPDLRRLAKEIADGDYEAFLASDTERLFETAMLRGMVIGRLRIPTEEKLARIADFIPRLRDWSVCDSACSSFRFPPEDRETVFRFVAGYAEKDGEFEQRFCAVMLRAYFLDDEYINRTLRLLHVLRHSGYYARMAVAWALCDAFIRQRDKTLAYLESGECDPDILRKTVQKCRDSRRVCAADKALLKGRIGYE